MSRFLAVLTALFLVAGCNDSTRTTTSWPDVALTAVIWAGIALVMWVSARAGR